MSETFRERYPPPWRVDELSSGYRVVSSNGYTLAWIYSAEGIERSADPERLTHREARTMAEAIAALGHHALPELRARLRHLASRLDFTRWEPAVSDEIGTAQRPHTTRPRPNSKA